MKGRRGVTLPEIIVASTLTMIVLVVVYSVLTKGLRMMHRADADTRAQQQAMLAAERLFGELAYSDYRSLTFLENPQAVSFLSLEPPRRTGLPVLGAADVTLLANFTWCTWRKFTAFSVLQQRLVRQEFPYGGTTQMASLPNGNLAALLANPQYPSTLVARGIERFTLELTNTPGLLRLVVVTRHDWDKPRITRLETTLAMRN